MGSSTSTAGGPAPAQSTGPASFDTGARRHSSAGNHSSASSPANRRLHRRSRSPRPGLQRSTALSTRRELSRRSAGARQESEAGPTAPRQGEKAPPTSDSRLKKTSPAEGDDPKAALRDRSAGDDLVELAVRSLTSFALEDAQTSYERCLQIARVKAKRYQQQKVAMERAEQAWRLRAWHAQQREHKLAIRERQLKRRRAARRARRKLQRNKQGSSEAEGGGELSAAAGGLGDEPIHSGSDTDEEEDALIAAARQDLAELDKAIRSSFSDPSSQDVHNIGSDHLGDSKDLARAADSFADVAPIDSDIDEAEAAETLARANLRLCQREFLDAFTDYTRVRADGTWLGLPMEVFELFAEFDSGSFDGALVRDPKTSYPPRHNPHAGMSGRPAQIAGGTALTTGVRSLIEARPPHAAGASSSQLPPVGAGATIAAPLTTPAQARILKEANDVAELLVHIDESDRPKSVNALEILLMMALLCDAGVEHSLGWVFTIFDTDENGTMSKSELLMLMRVLTAAAYKLRFIDRPATEDDIEEMGDSCFFAADADDNYELSRSEFVVWARTQHQSRKLLARFRGDPRVVERDKKRMRAAVLGLQDMAVQLATPADLAAASPSVAAANARAHRTGRREAMSRANQRRIAQRAERETRKLLVSLELQTNFNFDELDRLRRIFAAEVDQAGRGVPELRRNKFKSIMMREYPEIAGDNMDKTLDAMFNAWDTDDSGGIDYNGNDSNMELDQARQLLERLDADGDGSISRAEFLGQLTDSPVLLEAFTRSVAPTLVKKREVFRSLLNSSQAVPLDVLLSIWKDTPPEVRRSKVSRSGWRRWLLPQLSRNQIKGDAGPIANKVYRALEPTGEGASDLRTLVAGLTKVLQGPPDKKAEIMFALFDDDSSGLLDRHELSLMLEATASVRDEGLLAVSEAVQSIADNSGGVVTFTAFKRAAKRDARVQDYLNTTFGDNDEDELVASPSQTSPQSSRGLRRVARMTNGLLRSAEDDLQASGMEAADDKLYKVARLLAAGSSAARSTQMDAAARVAVARRKLRAKSAAENGPSTGSIGSHSHQSVLKRTMTARTLSKVVDETVKRSIARRRPIRALQEVKDRAEAEDSAGGKEGVAAEQAKNTGISLELKDPDAVASLAHAKSAIGRLPLGKAGKLVQLLVDVQRGRTVAPVADDDTASASSSASSKAEPAAPIASGSDALSAGRGCVSSVSQVARKLLSEVREREQAPATSRERSGVASQIDEERGVGDTDARTAEVANKGYMPGMASMAAVHVGRNLSAHASLCAQDLSRELHSLSSRDGSGQQWQLPADLVKSDEPCFPSEPGAFAELEECMRRDDAVQENRDSGSRRSVSSAGTAVYQSPFVEHDRRKPQGIAAAENAAVLQALKRNIPVPAESAVKGDVKLAAGDRTAGTDSKDISRIAATKVMTRELRRREQKSSSFEQHRDCLEGQRLAGPTASGAVATSTPALLPDEPVLEIGERDQHTKRLRRRRSPSVPADAGTPMFRRRLLQSAAASQRASHAFDSAKQSPTTAEFVLSTRASSVQTGPMLGVVALQLIQRKTSRRASETMRRPRSAPRSSSVAGQRAGRRPATASSLSRPQDRTLKFGYVYRPATSTRDRPMSAFSAVGGLRNDRQPRRSCPSARDSDSDCSGIDDDNDSEYGDWDTQSSEEETGQSTGCDGQGGRGAADVELSVGGCALRNPRSGSLRSVTPRSSSRRTSAHDGTQSALCGRFWKETGEEDFQPEGILDGLQPSTAHVTEPVDRRDLADSVSSSATGTAVPAEPPLSASAYSDSTVCNKQIAAAELDSSDHLTPRRESTRAALSSLSRAATAIATSASKGTNQHDCNSDLVSALLGMSTFRQGGTGRRETSWRQNRPSSPRESHDCIPTRHERSTLAVTSFSCDLQLSSSPSATGDKFNRRRIPRVLRTAQTPTNTAMASLSAVWKQKKRKLVM